ncbi:hypothetical protein Tco_1438672 [Tanacetum coccineum]
MIRCRSEVEEAVRMISSTYSRCCEVDGGGGGGGGGEVFGGEVFGGSVVFSGDGAGNGVTGVVCGVACRVVCGGVY